LPRRNQRKDSNRSRKFIRVRKPRSAGSQVAQAFNVPIGSKIRRKYNPLARRKKFDVVQSRTAGLKVRLNPGMTLQLALEKLKKLGKKESKGKLVPKSKRRGDQ